MSDYVIPEIKATEDEMISIRHYLHANPAHLAIVRVRFDADQRLYPFSPVDSPIPQHVVLSPPARARLL